jgi:hypothetical protein
VSIARLAEKDEEESAAEPNGNGEPPAEQS